MADVVGHDVIVIDSSDDEASGDDDEKSTKGAGTNHNQHSILFPTI